jgi:ATP-dependent protease HslVU (ClpYQ) peptidase subunit
VTTIIGIQGDGWAFLACDSRVSSFDTTGLAYQSTTLTPGTGKLASNGKWILGAAGDVRAINLLHHAFSPPTPHPGLRGRKLDQFLTTKFIPALRDCFEEHGYATPDNDEKQHIAEMSSTVIAAVNATIYAVDGDYSWTTDTTGVYALGTGAAYALGAIHALRGNDGINTLRQAKSIATKALTIAARLDPHTGPPIQTHTQTTDARNDKT